MDDFVVLGGQHLCEALKKRAEEYEKQGLDAPEPFLKVVCRVLRHDTPVGVRQMAAGDNQAAQLSVQQLSLVDFARLFLVGAAWSRVGCPMAVPSPPPLSPPFAFEMSPVHCFGP